MRNAARSTTDCRKTLVSNALFASMRGMRSSQPLNGPSTGCCRPPKPSATGSNVTLFTRTPILTSVRSKQRGGSSSAQTTSVPSMRCRAAATTCSVAPSTISLRSIRIVVSARNPDTWYRKRSERRPAPAATTMLPLRSRTPLLISKRSAKSAPQRSRNSQLIDSDEVLKTAICSRAPPPTSRRRRTATLWARRRGRVGIRQEEGRRVVVDRPRLEQRERPSVELELPPAHEARVLVHETSDRARRHVAARVREHERPPLEDCDRVGAQFGGARSLVLPRRGWPGLRIRVERRRAPFDRRCLFAGASIRAHDGKARTTAEPNCTTAGRNRSDTVDDRRWRSWSPPASCPRCGWSTSELRVLRRRVACRAPDLERPLLRQVTGCRTPEVAGSSPVAPALPTRSLLELKVGQSPHLTTLRTFE